MPQNFPPCQNRSKWLKGRLTEFKKEEMRLRAEIQYCHEQYKFDAEYVRRHSELPEETGDGRTLTRRRAAIHHELGLALPRFGRLIP